MGKRGIPKNQMKIIVCDAGPIIHLHEAGILSYLEHTGEIFIPYRVAMEIRANTNIGFTWPAWLQIVQLTESELKQTEMWVKTGGLHSGEAEALILARLKKADWLLTDDSAARLFASLLGLEVHGSLGIVLWNVAHGYLSQNDAEQALTNLEKSSLWLPVRIFDEARLMIRKMTF
jgi:predicted nucleic acid-binding protein